ncbi:MAG: WD40/YVTN/BNR-like repeat-containing protein [Kiritimatiellia bacterium]
MKMKNELLLAVVVALVAPHLVANPLPARVRGLATENRVWRSVGPGGGGWIQSMLWSRHARDRFFVGCDVGGFYYSEDAGRHYEMRNRGLENMFVETIAEHPANPDVLFVGTLGGIFKTTDRGLSWRAVRTGFPPVAPYANSVQISRIVFHPVRPETIFAAVGQPRQRKGARGEIWRSDDGGETWWMCVARGLAADIDVFDLSIHDGAPERMLIATNKGLFRSADGGAVWEPSNDGLPAHLRTRRLARCAARPDVVYVSLRQKGGEAPWSAGVYRSDDGGRTWVARSGGLAQNAGRAGCDDHFCTWTDCLAVDAANPDVVWTGGASWWYPGVYKTVDGGRTWRDVVRNRRPGWITFWGPTAYSMALSPLDGGRLAYGTSGMVYTTGDGGETWQQRYSAERTDGRLAGTGLEVTCLHTITPSRHHPGRFYLGYYDIGLLVTEDGGRSMTRRMAGVPDQYSNSCFTLAEAPDDPNVVWAGFGNWGGGGTGCIAKSVDGGATWSPCTNAANGWVEVVARNLTVLGRKPNYEILYAGGKGLVASRDGGATWGLADVGAFPEAPRVRALALTEETVFAGVDCTDDEPAAVFARRGLGGDWRRLTPPNLNIGEVQSLAAEGRRILVTARSSWRARIRKARPGGVWLSVDGGATWRQVYADRFCGPSRIVEGELYVGLSDHPYHDQSVGGGVIHSRDDGATWTVLAGPGLQNWNPTCLAVDPANRRSLWCGTGGNSIFVSE